MSKEPKFSEGVKFDSGKPPLSWISDYALEQEALVLLHGESKYERHNWRKGMAWSRLIDATLRHIHEFNQGEDIDVDSGLSHLAHARCNLAFLLDYTQSHLELDDRYKPKGNPVENEAVPEWVREVLDTQSKPEEFCSCGGSAPCQCSYSGD